MSDILLEVKDLRTHFITGENTVKAVNGVSFSVRRGETFGLLGESGCGKSATCRSITRLINPPGQIIGGEILYEGTDLLKLPMDKLRRLRGREISMIFQEPMTALNPVLPIRTQIFESLDPQMSRAQKRARALELMHLVGIPSPEKRIDEYIHQFSGGMRQRVGIAIALACTPALLIADEPTTALDVTIQAQVITLIKNLQKKVNTSLLLITHDLGIVAEICDDVAIMYAGRVVECSNIVQLYSRPMHPYTQGLFDAVPRLDSKPGGRLKVIQGLMPDPTDLPKGCSFSPRCPYAQNICYETACGFKEYEPGHFVDCYFPLGSNGGQGI